MPIYRSMNIPGGWQPAQGSAVEVFCYIYQLITTFSFAQVQPRAQTESCDRLSRARLMMHRGLPSIHDEVDDDTLGDHVTRGPVRQETAANRSLIRRLDSPSSITSKAKQWHGSLIFSVVSTRTVRQCVGLCVGLCTSAHTTGVSAHCLPCLISALQNQAMTASNSTGQPI